MNNVDKQYLDLLQDIIDNGTWKETRSGSVKSVFGRMMRFNLKEGLPLLTTKKVFYKGIIHELLWFISGNTNIKYLVDNNVHIWDDDAYRWFKSLTEDKFYILGRLREKYHFHIVSENKEVVAIYNTLKELIDNIDKETFIKYVSNGCHIDCIFVRYDNGKVDLDKLYTFGDLGPVYGAQWRGYGKIGKVDQLRNVIDTLNTNPDDRRMIVCSWNAEELNHMALPPCHYTFHFYTRELSKLERLDWLCEHSHGEYDEWKNATQEKLDSLNVPKRELSCSFNMRSNDFCCGNPFNIAQYAILTYMIAQCVNMAVGELVFFGEDVHVYENQIADAEEQLKRDPHKYKLPKLWLNPEIKDIDDFKFEDIKIEGYESYPAIKYKLNVG